MKNLLKNIWFVLAIGLIAGIFIGNFVGGDKAPENAEEHFHDASNEDQIWTCSMHPQIQKDGPGQCPLCGMDLIPLENSGGREDMLPDEVPMSASAMKLAEIQTYVVKMEKPEKEIRLLGKVKADERLNYSQTAQFPGRIEKLYVNFTGEKVYKGQKLATIYSPELVSAQKELFEVLKDDSPHIPLLEAARSKLKQWKFSDKQIAELEKSKAIQTEVDILSDYDGYVVMRMVSEGDHFKEGQSLFEITDLSKVWVLFDAYESDLPRLKVGDNVEFEVKSNPGKIFNAKATFIDPFINPKTRVAQVRVEVDNKKGLLKPDMYVNGIVTSKVNTDKEALLVPKSAVLWTGKRAVVYVKMPNREHNSFIYREIILGQNVGDSYIVLEGLEAGEEIATNGVFKIDASAQLAGKKSMMNPTGTKGSTGHNHGGKAGDDSKMDMTRSLNIDKAKIPAAFKQQLGAVVAAYLPLKEKLANDNSDIQPDALQMEKMLTKVDMSLVLEDAHNSWMTTLTSLNKDLKRLSTTVNIDEQRNVFLTISKALSDAAMTFGIEHDEQPLYLEFCPMANDDKGGYWLSGEKEIKNPYFGEKMLRCGVVEHEFE